MPVDSSFTLASTKSLSSAKAMISSKRCSSCARRKQMIAPYRKTFSRTESSWCIGWPLVAALRRKVTHVST